MFLGLLAAVVGGVSLAATLLIISKVARIDMPRWLYPAVAGIGMIALTIYIEYTWFSTARAELPNDVEVVETFSRTSVLQPWTFLAPRVDRFMAVDHGSVRLNPDVDDVVLIDVYLMERLNPTLQATQFIHCGTASRMLVGDATEFTDDGLPADEDWVPLGEDDPLVLSVCGRHHSADEAQNDT